MLARIIIAAAVLAVAPSSAHAHGGGLDSLGCHHNRKAGGYHCHRGPLAGQHFGSKAEARGSMARRPTAQPRHSAAKKPAATITGRASIIDGDTIEIHGTRIRLHGIDAPESQQRCRADGEWYRCGQKSTLALTNKIDHWSVTCTRTDIDRYGRTVARCWQGAVSLNAWMVLQGWAVAYRQYSLDYVPHEAAAKAVKRGVWRGEFHMPWDWRQARRKP